jgi:alpha-1,3-mannosyltransferase
MRKTAAFGAEKLSTIPISRAEFGVKFATAFSIVLSLCPAYETSEFLLRIVQVVRQFSPAIGGLEESVLSLTRELRRRHDMEIHVVTLDRVFSEGDILPRTAHIEGIPVLRIPFFGSRRYPIAPSILNALKNADLVHVHAVDFFFDALAFTAPLHRIPMVATTHGGFFHTSFASRAKQAYFNTITRMSCLPYRDIFATSHNDAKLFRRIAGSKVRVLENGVDIGKWSDLASTQLRRRLIYFGRLSANKRVDLLVDILRELRSDGHDWTLCIAGRADDVSFGEIAALSERAGIASAVEYVPSPSVEKIGQLIAGCSFYISASEHEGFGISAVEAMSAGLVPILSRIPAFERFIEPGLGVLMDPTDPKGAAAAIRTLYTDLQSDMQGRRLQLIALAKGFDWGHVSDVVAATYRRILAKPAS